MRGPFNCRPAGLRLFWHEIRTNLGKYFTGFFISVVSSFMLSEKPSQSRRRPRRKQKFVRYQPKGSGKIRICYRRALTIL
jgi:hypothetical protein